MVRPIWAFSIFFSGTQSPDGKTTTCTGYPASRPRPHAGAVLEHTTGLVDTHTNLARLKQQSENIPSMHGCGAWDCSCQGFSDLFRAKGSVGNFGRARELAEARQWWLDRGCTTDPTDLNDPGKDSYTPLSPPPGPQAGMGTWIELERVEAWEAAVRSELFIVEDINCKDPFFRWAQGMRRAATQIPAADIELGERPGVGVWNPATWGAATSTS